VVLGPIFLREWITVPRRGSHYLTRTAYLGGLWVIAVTAWLATLGWNRSATLGETARLGTFLFQLLGYVQLALILFFSALSCASAISREKDRRTFILLLMTDLRDHEIVLGKILGSLLPMIVFQGVAVPFLMMLVLLGGVGFEQVLQLSVVLFGTALAAGSLGAVVALWRERTFQSLALTVLLLVFYLLLVRGLGALPALFPSLDAGRVETVQQYLGPFLALSAVNESLLIEETGFAPAYGFGLCMLGLAVALNLFGMWRLRVWNPSGEPIMQREKPEEVEADPEAEPASRTDMHAAPGVARPVRGNPILWREIFTRAYGRRPLMVKLAYAVVLALICYSALAPLVRGEPRVPFLAAYGLIPVGVLSLLLVTAQATTAITSERDTGALDLLLVTDLSPQEFIFGKLLGIAYNTKEYLIPPFVLVVVYAAYGTLATPPAGHAEMGVSMNATSVVCLVACGAVLLGFGSVLGIHVALRSPNSQSAIIRALSTVFFLTVGTMICIALILINRQFEYQWGSFVFFLIAGVGGLWYVLTGDKPTGALTWASWFCPLAVLYAVMSLLVGRPGLQESADPVIPSAVIVGAFGFAIAAMLIPLLSEFDVAMGRTSGGAD
jgi:ABC-type transport system involved in multi-copper enzyme maturation permease subunit